MIHLPNLITDLALILGAAAFITLLFKKLKQPVVLGYIIAGLLVGPNFRLFPTVIEMESIRSWADIGVIFLLFSLGLEFSLKKLIKIGGVALITAITGVSLTLLLGYSIGKALGWGPMDCLFLGGMLAIASTTIIIRAFEELNVKTQKFTNTVLGVLIIEDLVAVLLMVLLSTVAVSRTFSGDEMIGSLLKLSFFLILWFASGIFFLPTLFKRLRSLMNEETLLIVSLALCFLMVVLATLAGFSSALGAFIMGSVLSETTKAEKIEHLIKPVKTLFGAIFFVSVGMLIEPQMLVKHAFPILAASLVLLLGKPLFVTLGALISGQPLKIAVQSGMSLSQIGEFSFIIATLGLSLNVTSDFLYPVAVAVSVITTFTTPYMIRLSTGVAEKIDSWLPEKWRNTLNTYSRGTQNIKDQSDWNILLRFYVKNMLIFSVLIITIILSSTRYILPLFSEYNWSRVITAIVTLIILIPFLWALAFKGTKQQAYANLWTRPSLRGPLIILLLSRIILAVLYVGFMLDQLFSPSIAALGALLTLVMLLAFSRKIKSFYARIELRFLSNLNGEKRENGSTHALAPWDTHFATFELNAYSPCLGKSLEELKLREKFGINIAVIKRGNTIINVPGRREYLYPNDLISVIGTDEQLHIFKEYLESSAEESDMPRVLSKVILQNFRIGEHSSLLGKSIRATAIRELSKGLVVGIERDGNRILNPESDTVFKLNDIVWVVGSEKRLQVLIRDVEEQSGP